MTQAGADYTNTFRALAVDGLPPGALFEDTAFRDWHARWRERQAQQDSAPAAGLALMRAANPAYIARNHRVEAVLAAATNDRNLAPLRELLSVLADPYTERAGIEAFANPPPPGDEVYQTFCGT